MGPRARLQVLRVSWDTCSVALPAMCNAIFAHQGFCVYEALAHIDMITCILTARLPVYNESFHIVAMTNQVECIKCVSIRNNEQQNERQA